MMKARSGNLSCVDLNGDASNGGVCGNACPAGKRCGGLMFGGLMFGRL